jgi:cellulose synthase/poly-beta-1,6-N-acetylglucosamine synthase-like glycosyltransferase
VAGRGLRATDEPGPTWPTVSVVVPVRDDAGRLPAALASILAQDYPGRLDVVVAVGTSGDDTDAVARSLASDDDRVVVVDNPAGLTPTGLNAGLAAATGDLVGFASSHSELAPTYVRRAVEVMGETGAAAVGGLVVPEGHTWFERVVAAAMSSPVAGANTAFRAGRAPGPVDTVAFGIYRRALLDEVGGFDESLVRNQDYELNWRVRQAGGVLVFHPDLRATYRPRGTLRAVARQYLQFGQWKREVVRRHPRSLRPRQLTAPLAVLVLAVSLAVGLLWALPALLIPAVYLAALVVAGIAAARFHPLRWVLVPAVLVTMHVAWGIGFLVGPPRSGVKETDARG